MAPYTDFGLIGGSNLHWSGKSLSLNFQAKSETHEGAVGTARELVEGETHEAGVAATRELVVAKSEMHEGAVGAARELVVEGETHEVGVAATRELVVSICKRIYKYNNISQGPG